MAEPAAVPLPRRLGRREPAALGGRVPRPRPLRPHLLQPGEHVRGRHPADRLRDGLVHRRRRVRAGDVGRVDHRQGPGHDLPRRAAAREGGNRRDRDARGARRRRGAHPAVWRRRSLRAERPACARDRAAHREEPQPREVARRHPRRAARAALSAGGARRRDPERRAQALRRARGHRPPRRRLRARRIQGELRDHARDRVRAHLRLPDRDRRQQRHPLLRVGDEGRALHRALLRSAGSRSSSCRTSPGSWSGRSTRRPASRRTARRW